MSLAIAPGTTTANPASSAGNFTGGDGVLPVPGRLAIPGAIGSYGDLVPETYPGGKGGSGVYQTIINQMPPHRVYIEPFLGSARVMRAKLPADRNIGIDLNGEMIAQARKLLPSTELTSGDGIGFLERFKWAGGELVYCDPPYLMETRSSKRPVYKFEVTHHQRLLNVVKRLPCYVIVSGYWSELYSHELKAWRVVTYQAMTRGGKQATEVLWCNFPEPVELHDYRYLGRGFRERERIKRKKSRWVKKLAEMPTLERYAILAAIKDVRDRQPRHS